MASEAKRLRQRPPAVSSRDAETRVEIDIADVGATAERFQAIGEDPDRFQAFVNAGGGGCLSNAAAVERKTEREPPRARAPMKHSSTYELSSHEAAHV